jgi:uncharacterized YccA/Bax inhibitor family protein
MSTQVLNEQTFAPANVQRTLGGRTAERTMTIGGSAIKSFLLLLLVVGFAVFGWNFALRVVATTSGVLFLVGFIILIALTYAAVSNPRLAPLLGVVYAGLMGTWMGAISRGVRGVLRRHSRAGGVRIALHFRGLPGALRSQDREANPEVRGRGRGSHDRHRSALRGGLVAQPLRHRPGFPVPAHATLGIGLSIAICLVAALNLILDFAVIEGGARGGAPKEMEWLTAFGLVSTLVWLYLEILRLMALLARNR